MQGTQGEAGELTDLDRRKSAGVRSDPGPESANADCAARQDGGCGSATDGGKDTCRSLPGPARNRKVSLRSSRRPSKLIIIRRLRWADSHAEAWKVVYSPDAANRVASNYWHMTDARFCLQYSEQKREAKVGSALEDVAQYGVQ